MTGRLNRICLLALLAAVLAATAAAQQAKPIANWVNLNQLVAGSEIRVTLATGKTMRGFVQRVTASHWRSTRPPARRCSPGRTSGASNRKSTRLNSSHLGISYAVFCLKKNRTDEQR